MGGVLEFIRAIALPIQPVSMGADIASIATSFGIMLTTIVLAYIFKIVFFRDTFYDKAGVLLKLIFNVTMPITLFRSLANTKGFNIETLYLFLIGLGFQLFGLILSSLCFGFIKDYTIRYVSIANCVGLNISLFVLPIVESFSGDEGVEKLILFNLGNEVFLYFIMRPLYAVCQLRQQNEVDKDDILIENPDDLDKIETGKGSIEIEMKEEAELQLEMGNSSEMSSGVLPPAAETPSIIVQAKNKKNTKQVVIALIKKILVSIFTAVPLYAIFLGFMFGLFQVKIPGPITQLIHTVSQANSPLAWIVLGVYFRWNVPVKSLFPILRVVAFRVIYGAAYALIMYYSLRNHLNYLTLYAILVCPVMPSATTNIIYNSEYDIKPPFFAVGIVNMSMVSSFIMLLIFNLGVQPQMSP